MWEVGLRGKGRWLGGLLQFRFLWYLVFGFDFEEKGVARGRGEGEMG